MCVTGQSLSDGSVSDDFIVDSDDFISGTRLDSRLGCIDFCDNFVCETVFWLYLIIVMRPIDIKSVKEVCSVTLKAKCGQGLLDFMTEINLFASKAE